MSLKSVYFTLEKLADTPSILDKQKILEGALKEKLFKKVVKYALDPRKKYKVKKLPQYKENNTLHKRTIFEILDRLALQTGVTNQDKTLLADAASIDRETYEVVYRICNSDLRCGCGVRLINKVRSGTIPFTPYLRCSTKKHLKNIKYPAIIQEKANGMYAEMVIDDGKITFGTRDSKKIKKLKHLKRVYWNSSASEKEKFNNIVLMGEMRVYNKDGSVADRQTGNGIINQCIQGTVKKEDAERVFFSIWDAIPLECYEFEKCNTPYEERLDTVIMFCAECSFNSSFQHIMYNVVNSEEEAQSFANELIKAGGEGAVLKNTKATWKHGKSLEQIKLKALFEGELRVLSWDYGNKGKKHAHRMGRITVGTDDGLVVCSIGGGFSDALRDDNWDKHLGRIVEVEYQEVSDSKSRKDEVKSLYGPPVFVCFRDDKDETDTLDDLMNR